MYVLTVELVQMFARLKLSTQLNNTIYNKKYRLLSIEGSLFFTTEDAEDTEKKK
jgi:hypothetical protein